MKMEERISGPLEGIKVLDFGQAALGPVCGRLLADLGADVIKVEPLEGDFARLTPEPMVDSITFMVTNLNKRSLSVNLRDPRGKEIILKLVPKVDVIIQNFRPGALKNLGLDYETLSRINPRLVYGSFYMYGEKGPLARRRGGDMWAQAFTGLIASQGCPDGPPQMINHTVIDFAGGVAASFAIMVALFFREKSGVGQEVSSNLVNIGVILQWPTIAHYLAEGLLYKKVGRGSSRSNFPYGPYKAKDGDVLTIFGQDQEEWVTVCSILGLEHLLQDPRYDTVEKRNEKKSELYPVLDEAFSKRTRTEWEQLFKEQKLRCDSCLDYAEFAAHPQFEANKLAVKVNDPRDGELTFPSSPLRFSKFPPLDVCNHAPILGEHTKEILQGLGYSEEDINQLHEQGVVGIPTSDMFEAKRTRKGTYGTGRMYRGGGQR
jgi:crotonobetainyl-CoA:carnitine CoA-transferase CaiB-like acyl-CoA transferase